MYESQQDLISRENRRLRELEGAPARSLERIAAVLEEHRQARETERVGRQSELRRMSAALFLNASGLSREFEPVPDQFVTAGTVRCPCNQRHSLEVGELRSEECGRAFIRTRNAVLVLSPVTQERKAA